MDNQFAELIISELKEMSNEQKEMGKTLAAQHITLLEHMRRTELNEEAIVSLKDDLYPVQKHVMYTEGALKFIGGLAVVAGLFLTIIKIIEFFK